ncbi:MAG: hypothetical protein OXC06_00895 [Acidimicrobiaceae bacterium]|nr:hypothetical protein [Acidimicrobiaceae bacterium]
MSGRVAARDLRDMMVEQGVEFASAAQIGEWIGCSPAQVPHRLRGARQAQEMVCVTRGGWVPAVAGCIDPQAFMEPMMGHFGHRYYLAGLSAAARHGASHQALMVDHFATSSHLTSRTIRNMARIEMFHRPDVEAFPTVTQQAMSWTGHLQPITVSTAEVAVFDLFALHPFRGGDAKETVACELLDPGPRLPPALDAETLASVALLYPVPTRQRVGFLLQEMSQHVGRGFDLDPLEATLPASARTVEFEYDPDRSEPPVKHDDRWDVRQWYEMWPDV